jgi:arylsulfatase A-like enzyme
LGARIAGIVAAISCLVAVAYLARPAPPTSAAAAEVASETASTARRPNILLFTIDTLRADHVHAEGYARETSPTIDALAARGTRFTRAYAASTWTVPSVASILSGVLPSQHGVRHGLRTHGQIAEQEVLSPELPHIAAILAASGYRTFGVTANPHLSPMHGFERGFEHYENVNFGTVSQVRPLVAQHLDEIRSGDAPWFLWVHVVDPHAPYQATAPAFDTFRDRSLPHYQQIDDDQLEGTLDRMMRRELIPAEDGWAYAIAAYDSEIWSADAYLAELLGPLDDGNLAVVLTADHGEEFHDHNGLGHGHTAFDEVARVPLIVSLPGTTPRVVEQMVSLIDVLPTILEIGAAASAASPGRSLVSAARGEAIEDRDAVIETGRGTSVVQAIVSGSFKYGEQVRPVQLSALFDLGADPGEQHNLVLERAPLAATLQQRLLAVLAAAEARRPAVTTSPYDVTPEVRDQLRALGYEN